MSRHSRYSKYFQSSIRILLLFVLPVALLSSGWASSVSAVEPAVSFVNFSPSFTHTLAIASDGTAWAWGDNSRGEVNGEQSYSSQKPVPRPVKVDGLTNVVAVAAGSYFSMALTSDGTVWTWGDNSLGQLGIGSADKDYHSTPTRVPDLADIKNIVASQSNAMALGKDGVVWAWGSNVHGESGDGKPTDVEAGASTDAAATQNRPYPCRVCGLDGVISIAFAGANGIALKDDGTIWGWGMNNELLGEWHNNNHAGYTSTPVLIARIDGATKIAGYGSSINAIALRNDGTMWTWGQNRFGALGSGNDNEYYFTLKPVQVQCLSHIVDVTSGYHLLALSENGTVWAWGWCKWNGRSEGGEDFQSLPAIIPQISAVKSIYEGAYSNFAIDQTGTIWAWGDNSMGQLGDGKSSQDPFGLCVFIPIKVLTDYSAIAVATKPPDVTPTVVPLYLPSFPPTISPDQGGSSTDGFKTVPWPGFLGCSLTLLLATGLIFIRSLRQNGK